MIRYGKNGNFQVLTLFAKSIFLYQTLGFVKSIKIGIRSIKWKMKTFSMLNITMIESVDTCIELKIETMTHDYL